MPDPDKVSAVNKLPVPRNVADIGSVLGATGYFHEHVQAYAEKSAPLRALLKKNVELLWTGERLSISRRTSSRQLACACRIRKSRSF